MPTLAYNVVQHNKVAINGEDVFSLGLLIMRGVITTIRTRADKINLKGIMVSKAHRGDCMSGFMGFCLRCLRLLVSVFQVGNGCIGNSVGTCGTEPYNDYLMISQLHGHGFVSDIAFANMNKACGDWVPPESAACRLAVEAANAEAGTDYCVYDLYAGTYNLCPYGVRKGQRPSPRMPGAVPRRPMAKGSIDRVRHDAGNT